jgi:hypothetical protein
VTTTDANGLPTIDRPCPPWCEMPTGHGWDSEDLGGLFDVRGHGLDVGTVDGGDASVSICNFESSTVGDASEFSLVVILLDSCSAELNPGRHASSRASSNSPRTR